MNAFLCVIPPTTDFAHPCHSTNAKKCHRPRAAARSEVPSHWRSPRLPRLPPHLRKPPGFQFVIYFYGDDVDHADIEATAINIHDPTEGWEASFKSETLGLMDLLEALGKKGKVTMKPAGTDTSLVVTTAKGDIVLPLRRLSPVDATASANIFVMNSLNRMRADQAMSQMMTQLFAPQQSLALPGGPGGILQMLLTR